MTLVPIYSRKKRYLQLYLLLASLFCTYMENAVCLNSKNARGEIRTHDLLLRRQLLCPAELRAHTNPRRQHHAKIHRRSTKRDAAEAIAGALPNASSTSPYTCCERPSSARVGGENEGANSSRDWITCSAMLPFDEAHARFLSKSEEWPWRLSPFGVD